MQVNSSTCAFLFGAAFAFGACERASRSEPAERTSPDAPDVKDTPPPPLVSPTPAPATTTISPARAARDKDPLAGADDDMKKVLDELQALGVKSTAELTPPQAREQPTPADAVKRVLEKEGKPATPIEMATVVDRKIPGARGQLAARIYTPKTDQKKPLPVVAYWHGGGFVIADLDSYDASARALADQSTAIVVSLDYRRAPEHKFPAAHDDAFAGYRWVVKNAASFGGDAKRVAVAGESAGANLAANVAIMARDKGIPMPVHQLLIYPVAQTNMQTESYSEWAQAKPLDKRAMTWFMDQYSRNAEDAKDPRLDLVSAKLEKLPPTTIILAEIDPLRSDGEALADKLEAADVDVEKKTYEGVTHEFFGMGAAVSDAKSAASYAGTRLRNAFDG